MSPLTLPHLPPHLILHLPRTCLLTSKCSTDTSSSGRFDTSTPCPLCMFHIFLQMFCDIYMQHVSWLVSAQQILVPLQVYTLSLHVTFTLPHLPPHLILHLPRTCLLTSKCSIDTSSSGRFYTATPCSLCMVHIFLHMLCFLSPKHFPSPASPQPLTPPVVISPVPCHVHVHSFSLLRELLHPLTCHLWLSEKLPHTDNSALAFSD